MQIIFISFLFFCEVVAEKVEILVGVRMCRNNLDYSNVP